MDSSSAVKQGEYLFPLMKLLGDIRNIIYRHALRHALPKLILPRWMLRMQRSIGHPETSGRFAASSFASLQLCSRQLYYETSYILYQSCQFCFSISQNTISFLDACLLSWNPTRQIQDKTYIRNITNIVVKADWDGYDRAAIWGFPWRDWIEVTSVVCNELQGFSGLRRLTLDWRVPNPCDVLQPTRKQWLSISRYFERLQARCPKIRMEVLAWQILLGSRPREICMSLESYAEVLREAAERLEHTPKFLPESRFSSH